MLPDFPRMTIWSTSQVPRLIHSSDSVPSRGKTVSEFQPAVRYPHINISAHYDYPFRRIIHFKLQFFTCVVKMAEYDDIFLSAIYCIIFFASFLLKFHSRLSNNVQQSIISYFNNSQIRSIPILDLTSSIVSAAIRRMWSVPRMMISSISSGLSW
jgi:hypothetical protein